MFTAVLACLCRVTDYGGNRRTAVGLRNLVIKEIASHG